ncbi:hypothetical protein KUH03_09485 [Sphingobacterium sp. E70]|nr:hypothetical protein KUH03_09485 [Sphingobacterium sp. E70]
MRQGKKEEAEAVKSQSSGYKEQVKQLLDKLGAVEIELNDKIVQLPNLPHHSVPVGVSADDNEVVLTNGEIPALSEDALPHWELLNKYDIVDLELGVKVAGAGFPIYKGKGQNCNVH